MDYSRLTTQRFHFGKIALKEWQLENAILTGKAAHGLKLFNMFSSKLSKTGQHSDMKSSLVYSFFYAII